MSQDFRLSQGGRIDRGKPLDFRFDGRDYQGYQGDTLASALLANGEHLVGRSFKYHRPRGILSAGSEEPNALVTVGRDAARVTPNLRATTVELYDGLVAESQNRWPSLDVDLGAVGSLFAPLLVAGFYYKTFMGPRGFWHRLYEPAIRAAAGLGRAPDLPDPDRYAQRYAHCDVLVVGAGPTGLAAAGAAAAAGVRVWLCDEQAELGGSLLSEAGSADWLAAQLAELAAKENVTLLPRCTAFSFGPHSMIGLAERVSDHLAAPDPRLPRERLWLLRAKQVVLATGALERPLIFPDNDRPGIMLADAARLYVARYGVRPGTQAALVATHDGAYRSALELHAVGIGVSAIIDPRPDPAGPFAEAARRLGLRILRGHSVAGTGGRKRVSRVEAVSLQSGRRQSLACDLLLMSGGHTPTLHLFSQARGSLQFDAASGAFLPGSPVEALQTAGACRGITDLSGCIADGALAGERAAVGGSGAVAVAVAVAEGGDGFPGALPQPGKASTRPCFVDFQNDVTSQDLALAVREGFRSIEHIKRYTTAGMATDQGKTSNMNALALAARAQGKSLPEVGLTTFRAPYTPTSFGIFAGLARGALFDPERRTPIHDWAAEQNAIFEDAGLWKRARAFPRGPESLDQAVARECRAVRSAAGLFDASTLGKIELVGRDAGEFLDRLYINPVSGLAPGRCRYAVMLREDGMILDDGVIGRLAPDRFHVTTTTGGAARVLAQMEDYRQTEWRELEVWLTATTDQWAVIALQGPAARQILAPLIADIDLSPAAMPKMSLRQGTIAGVATRLSRVSFTGELGFEIAVPSSQGREVWEALIAAGRDQGITPYGTDAMHVLRAEKGFIIIGQETDGTVTPDDVGLGGAIGRAKPDFVGKRSLALPALAASGRKQLVGLVSQNPQHVLEEGAQLVAAPGDRGRALGHVTSAYVSATLGQAIALALVENGRARHGDTLFVPMPRETLAVTVVPPVFYDPPGARLDV